MRDNDTRDNIVTGSASDWQKQFSSDVISQGSQWWHLEMSASKIKSIEFP